MSRKTETRTPTSRIDAQVLEMVFAYSHDAICVVDLDADRIVECNPAATELLGYSRDQLLSMPASELHPHNFAEFRTFADSVVEEGSGWTDALTCYGKDGRQIPAEISATVCELDGQTCLISIIRDVSTRRRHREELQRENDRLELLARIVSHDLRNPLNVLAGHLELAREGGDDEHFETMASALDRAFDIIDDTLILAKRGGTVEDTEPVRLGDIVETCWGNVETGHGTLDVDSDCQFVADPDRLQHLLENLIRNAIEHGGDDVTVSVGSLPNGFYIADSGRGIREADRDRIFELGYTTADEGTGYGLAIAKHMANAHGWTITVTESESGGARFEITGFEDDDPTQ